VIRWLRLVVVLAPLVALGVRWCSPPPAATLPLFARKYSFQCTQCHYAFPRLNAFGMAFKQNGYRLPGAKGESPWESTTFPLSLLGNVGYAYTRTDAVDSTGGRSTFATSTFQQNDVEFHSAGTLAPEVTFRFDNSFEGVDLPLTSGQAFVQFDDLVHDGRMNMRVGVYDADILYLADSRRMTLTHYLSPITLGGLGVELNGRQSGWTWAGGVINSDRTIGKPTDKSLNNFEDVYAFVTRDVVRGQLASARVFVDQQDPRRPDKRSAQHLQVDVNAFLNGKGWWVIPGFTYEHFADADFSQFDKQETALLDSGLLFGPSDRWAATARFELQHHPKFDFEGVTAFPEADLTQLTGNVGYYVNPNAKLVLEYNRIHDNVQGPRVDQIQAYVFVGY
jgi:hypothetical protein